MRLQPKSHVRKYGIEDSRYDGGGSERGEIFEKIVAASLLYYCQSQRGPSLFSSWRTWLVHTIVALVVVELMEASGAAN